MGAPPSPENPLSGSCLCGGVRFEVTAPFRRANHCHCSRCRKHSGTFGETQGRVPREGFRLLQGEDLIQCGLLVGEIAREGVADLRRVDGELRRRSAVGGRVPPRDERTVQDAVLRTRLGCARVSPSSGAKAAT